MANGISTGPPEDVAGRHFRCSNSLWNAVVDRVNESPDGINVSDVLRAGMVAYVKGEIEVEAPVAARKIIPAA